MHCWSARGRGTGHERKDLEANGRIFTEQGGAQRCGQQGCPGPGHGNPANTNALIAMRNAPDPPAHNFSAMTRLDHNRGLSQLASAAGVPVASIERFTIWGNHSSTQVPDASNAHAAGQPLTELVDSTWLEQEFIPAVQQRGAAIINARGASSAASAASAAIDHMRDWVQGTPEGDWISMAIPSNGHYGIRDGLIYSFPVTVSGGQVQVVSGLEPDEALRKRMRLSEEELLEERLLSSTSSPADAAIVRNHSGFALCMLRLQQRQGRKQNQ